MCSPFTRDFGSAMDLRNEIVTFFITPCCDPRYQDLGLEGGSESGDGDLTHDDGERKGEDKVGVNSLPSDALINDPVALVIMVDEGKDKVIPK